MNKKHTKKTEKQQYISKNVLKQAVNAGKELKSYINKINSDVKWRDS